MGLDMYLYATKYEDWSKWDKDKKPISYPKVLEELEEDIKKRNFLSKVTKCKIGYWRKFNALHSHIVNTYNDGEDNCNTIWLSRKAIEDILNICKEVLEDLNTCPKTKKQVEYGYRNGKPLYEEIELYDSEKALELLPPSNGFFFGSQDIDELYKEKLEYTIQLLEKCLNLEENFDFEYDASW